jgi:hypothetical protein
MRAFHAMLTLTAMGSRTASATFGVTQGTEGAVNGQGTSDVSTVMLTDTQAISCYLDYGPVNQLATNGFCKAVDLSGATPSAGTAEQFGGNKPQHMTLARFTDDIAVLCYSRLGGDVGERQSVCNAMKVSNNELTKGDDIFVDDDPASKFIHELWMTSLSDTAGVVCYGNRTSNPNLKVNCRPMFLDSGDLSLTRGDNVYVNHGANGVCNFAGAGTWCAHHINRVVVAGFSATTAVVCSQVEESWVAGKAQAVGYGAFCNVLTLTGSTLSVSDKVYDVNEPADKPVQWLNLASLDEDTGIACYAEALRVSGGTNPEYEASVGKCRPFSLNGTQIVMGDLAELNPSTTTDISISATSGSAAIVCYLDGQDRLGTCNGIVLSRDENFETSIQIGAEEVIEAGAFSPVDQCQYEEFCSTFVGVSSIPSPLNMEGLVCYAGVGNDHGLRCRTLSVPPPTTTVTSTTSATETSSTTMTTTPHTTTETSTSSLTSTSVTTTSTMSTTSPHTTTETTTATSTTEVESDGAASGAIAAGVVSALMILHAC